MTRDELLELLHVERYTPLPRQPEKPRREPEPVVVDDSELVVKRRRRTLIQALEGYEDHRTATRLGA